MTDEPIGAWARRVDISTPVRMGRVEQEILSRPPTTSPHDVDRGRGGRMVAVVITVVIALALPLAVILPLRAAQASTSSAEASTLLGIAGSMSLVGAILPLVVLVIWWTVFDRHRTAFVLVFGIVMPITSIAGGLYLWGSSLRMPLLVAVSSIVGAIASVLLFALVAFASKPGGPDPRGIERAEIATREDAARLKDRAIALHVLRSRGLVDDAMYRRAIDMPLGSWGELDADPGEARS